MVAKVLSSLGGVSGFGLFSLCLFFVFFAAMAWWAVRLKPPYLCAMRQLPLENEFGKKSQPDKLVKEEQSHE